MDPRLEFAFQLLMDATQLTRNEVMDNVFEGDMLDEINLLFVPHMRSTLVWYYQEVEEPEPPTDTVRDRRIGSYPRTTITTNLIEGATEGCGWQIGSERDSGESEGAEGTEGTAEEEALPH